MVVSVQDSPFTLLTMGLMIFGQHGIPGLPEAHHLGASEALNASYEG
jgi:hypothetical protein